MSSRLGFGVLMLMFVVGCKDKTAPRSEPVEIKGTVALPSGASPKNLTITFQPQQNSLGGSAQLAADGSFTLKIEPGKYVYYFSPDSNSEHPAIQAIPDKYHSASEANSVSIESGKPLNITVN